MTMLKPTGSAALQPPQAQGNATPKTQLAFIGSKANDLSAGNNASAILPLPIRSKVSTYSNFLALQNNSAKAPATTTATPPANSLRPVPSYAPKNEANPLVNPYGSQRQVGFPLEPAGRSGAVPSRPVSTASISSVGAKQARVTVEGVSVPRFQQQKDMKSYTEADLTTLGINANNTRIYVLDNFSSANVSMGIDSKSNVVYATHGDVVAGIVSATLKGKGEVIRLDVGGRKVPEMTNRAFTQRINEVIATEAKRQNKTLSTVDLSQVTINASWSFSERASAKAVAAAISAFTARGGHFFASAGNRAYTGAGGIFPNSNIVDGSNQRVGQNIAPVQKPWSDYKNEAVDASGNDVRSKRLLDPTSQSIIAPSKLETRINKGAIEFRDDSNPKGWSKLVDASQTTLEPVPAPKTDGVAGLSGLKPQKLTSAKQLKDFQQWQSNAYGEAIKNAKDKNANSIRDLTPAESSAVETKVAAEKKRLLGDQPVMTLNEYLKYTGGSSDSMLHQQVRAGVPKGLTPEQVIVSAAQVIESDDKPSLQYYVLDKKVGLQTIQPDKSTTLTNGTSWATPLAAANHAIWQREQVLAAKAAAGQ